MQIHLHSQEDMTPEGFSNLTWALLVASYLPGVGKNTLWQIAADSSFPKLGMDGMDVIHPALSDISKRTPKFFSAESKALRQVDLCAKHGVDVVGYWDSAYPAYMRVAPSSPAVFWVRGNKECLQLPMAAVIGTREPTRDGEITAYRVSAALAERGVVVVSGLALGVDAIAHAACVDACKPTVAVMPCGLDSVSPKKNEELSARILGAGGILFSEFPVGAPSFSSNFVTRDSTQAALSSVVVLIQSGLTGGSLHASRAVLKLNRRLVVVNPTPRDIAYKEPKAAANIAFAVHDSYAISKMNFDLDRALDVYILRSKSQYDDLSELIKAHWQAIRTHITPDRRHLAE